MSADKKPETAAETHQRYDWCYLESVEINQKKCFCYKMSLINTNRFKNNQNVKGPSQKSLVYVTYSLKNSDDISRFAVVVSFKLTHADFVLLQEKQQRAQVPERRRVKLKR